MAFQGDSIFWVEVEKIVPNPFQPRREFNEEKLKELAESVRMYGILQPLTVTRNEVENEDGAFYSEYELISGERRLRAARIAGLSQVPVIIRVGKQSEQEKLELAIIENLQREDLNAVDRAFAFKQLVGTFKLSHAKVAKKVGRSREYVSNTIRLLALPEYMLSSLRKGDISEGHARTLLMLNDRPEELDTVFREILLKKLSVREVERITRKIASDKVRTKKWKDTDPELIEIERQFTESLGTRVQISKTDYGGKLTIDYFSEEDLDKLLKMVQAEGALHGNRVRKNDTEDEAEKGTEMKSDIEILSAHTPIEQIDEKKQQESERTHISEEQALKTQNMENVRVVSTSESMTQVPPADDVVELSHKEEYEPLVKMEQAEEKVTSQTETSSETENGKLADNTKDGGDVRDQAFASPEEIKEKEEDDSDLYAIKNFGV